jgi:predicted nucleic-acid-binding protein
MSKKNKVLLDANIIVRFLIGDGGQLYQRSVKLFRKIEEGKLKATLLEPVLAEVVYVLQKVYQVDPEDISAVLVPIIELKSIKTSNQTVIINALEIFHRENIDFVDAILCAYHRVAGLEVISFDKKLGRILDGRE